MIFTAQQRLDEIRSGTSLFNSREEAAAWFWKYACEMKSLERIVQAWQQGNLEEVIHRLRMAGIRLDHLRSAEPELFDVNENDCPF